MNKIDMRHWTDGGTALTNFDPKEEPIYLEAIKRFGDSDYVVVQEPMDKGGVIYTDYSLHCLSKKDSSAFYAVFRKLQSEVKN